VEAPDFLVAVTSSEGCQQAVTRDGRGDRGRPAGVVGDVHVMTSVLPAAAFPTRSVWRRWAFPPSEYGGKHRSAEAALGGILEVRLEARGAPPGAAGGAGPAPGQPGTGGTPDDAPGVERVGLRSAFLTAAPAEVAAEVGRDGHVCCCLCPAAG
jgi:hypothetical protein